MNTWPTAPIIRAMFQTEDNKNIDGFWKRTYEGHYEHWDTKTIAREGEGRMIMVNPYKQDNEIEKNIQYFLNRAREEALAPIREVLEQVNANNITDNIIDEIKNLVKKESK